MSSVNNLAIVIPFYKKKYFKNTLDSLKNQTDKKFTVYIGNDGSPDNIHGLINEYKTYIDLKYQEFTHIGYKNLSKHWDRCVKMTSGEKWFQILGDDDVLSPNFVECINDIISNPSFNNQINLISVERRKINEFDDVISSVKYLEDCGVKYSKEFFFERIMGRRTITLSENVFSYSAYEKYGLQDFPVAFGTDEVAFLQYTEMDKFFYCNKTFVDVRLSPEHLSSINNFEINQARIDGLKKSRKFILNEFADKFTFEEKVRIIFYMARIERNKFRLPYYLGVELPKIFISSLLK